MNRNPPHHIGEKNPAWKGGRSKNPQGYIMLTALPASHKYACMKGKNGQVGEHRIVMAEKLGRPLRKGEVVHHVDGDKENNHPDNLELFSSQSEHVKETFYRRLERLEKENEELKKRLVPSGILSASAIRRIRPVEPFVERGVIRGRSFGLSIAGYDIRIAESHFLLENEFALGSSLEKFSLPKNIVGLVKDKSSWARQGLSLLNTVAEPGWKGFLTLELKNQSHMPLRIEAGDPIAQILFFPTDVETEGYSGKYQNQQSGPQEVRYENA